MKAIRHSTWIECPKCGDVVVGGACASCDWGHSAAFEKEARR